MPKYNNNMIIGNSYELVSLLASGGMAEVYLARTLEKDRKTQKLVAIKKILPKYASQPKFREYFKREAEIAINMNHPNVVKSYKAYTDGSNEFCLVVDYIKGRNLKQISTKLRSNKQEQSLQHIGLLEDKLEIEDVVYIIKETARGLNYIHQYDMFDKEENEKPAHRDISPQNIMVGWEGEVKILDFGISKVKVVSSGNEDLAVDETTSIKGKFSYMSPEQTQGKHLDYRTDIFSLGVVMWEMLSNGKRLFYRPNEMKTIQNILNLKVPLLRETNQNVPEEIDNVVVQLLQRDPHKRMEAFELYEKLHEFLNINYPKFNPERLGEKFRKIFKEEYKKEFSRDKKVLSSGFTPKPSRSMELRSKIKSIEILHDTKRNTSSLRTPRAVPKIFQPKDTISLHNTLSSKISEDRNVISTRVLKKRKKIQKKQILANSFPWKRVVATIMAFAALAMLVKEFWYLMPSPDNFNENKAVFQDSQWM